MPCAVPVTDLDFSQASHLLVPIPVDFQKLKEVDDELALDWRLKTREVFVSLFSEGWAVGHGFGNEMNFVSIMYFVGKTNWGLIFNKTMANQKNWLAY